MDALTAELRQAFRDDERPEPERGRLVELMVLLARLPSPPDPEGLYPRYDELRQRLREVLEGRDAEAIEEAFVELYCHLHRHEAPYTAAERQRVDQTGGYWCHAGGLSPILKAEPWLGEHTVSADLGAGNGLQGLLLQKLYPHARTVQIEISSRMVQSGKELQRWLGIPNDRVEWLQGDLCQLPVPRADFLYLYRPVKPTGPGAAFYRRLAAELAARAEPMVIFSIADCLRDFLPPSFELFYTDGQLTCFRFRGR